jgi:ankyrin repeat protein
VQSGSVEVVQLLEQAGMQLSSITRTGTTLLMQAAVAEDTAVARHLLSQGAPVNACDSAGLTALHCAIMKDRAKVVKLLLAHGADANLATAAGLKPLCGAAVRGCVPIVKLLLAAGADTAALSTADIPSAFFAAAHGGHAEVLKLLLARTNGTAGATAQLNAAVTTCACCGPVTALQRCTDLACLKLLPEAEADVHAVTSRGNKTLHVAAQHKHPAPVICMLIKAGTSLSAVNSSGLTAAELALARGNTLGAALLSRAAR